MIPDELKYEVMIDGTARTGDAWIAANRSRQSLIESLPLARRVVRRSGVTLHLISYWSDLLPAWSGRLQKMVIRYDPRDLSRIYLCTPSGDYCDLSYRDLRRIPISLREHQLALEHLRRVKHPHLDEEAIFQAVRAMRDSADQSEVKPRNAGHACRRGLQHIPHSPTEPVGNSPQENPNRIFERPDNRKRRQPRRRILTLDEWS
jgi:putative transposase